MEHKDEDMLIDLAVEEYLDLYYNYYIKEYPKKETHKLEKGECVFCGEISDDLSLHLKDCEHAPDDVRQQPLKFMKELGF